jgi:hypothetical protein
MAATNHDHIEGSWKLHARAQTKRGAIIRLSPIAACSDQEVQQVYEMFHVKPHDLFHVKHTSMLAPKPKIGLDHFRIINQFTARTLQGNFTRFQHIGVIRNLQGRAGILLNQQNRNTPVFLEGLPLPERSP